jgi:peptidoglycan/xylan/chitin deacetylase (PgdA/CDA1 family)
MLNIKKRIDRDGPVIIEKFGYLINPLLLNFKKEKKQLLVFCFHGLFNSKKQSELNHIDPQHNMTADQFVSFIEYFLNHKYVFIKPEDLVGGIENNHPYAMLTFDDGYFNNMLAFEILEKYKIPAVIFISTRNITENRSFWWDIIYRFRIKQGNSFESISNEQRSLKSHNYQYIDNYIQQNFGMNSFKPWSDIDRPFNEKEIRDLAISHDITIGNHTHNHAILTNYNKEEIKEEYMESNKTIFKLTGSFPITTAFPNGNYNNLVLETTKEIGFKYAFTTMQKTNLLPIVDQNFACLNRYVTNTIKISKFGSFCRLGYEPDLLYAGLKMKIKAPIKRK